MSAGDPARRSGLWPDLAPWRSSRGFRLLFASRTVIALGVCAVLLLVNALLPAPALWPLYAVSAVMMAAAALQRPSLDASVPRLVRREQLTAASALLSLSQNACFLLGSALGGALAVTPGPWLVYGIDAVGFATSFGLLTLLPGLPGAADAGSAALRGITGGLRYAVRRQDLLGSYLADLAAMIFAYPNALFPFLAAELHARWATGLMFAWPAWPGRGSRSSPEDFSARARWP